MEIRISTSPEKWLKELNTMTSQGYFLCAREGKLYWEYKRE